MLTENKDILSSSLKSLLGLLSEELDPSLKQEIVTLINYLQKPTFRIAVFAPFNYGKSTLLNALLGQKTLPIDLIPTTGAAIKVCYGEVFRSQITLKNGQELSGLGGDLLKEYAILDQQRKMRDDVTQVTVYLPHSFLKLGIEFLDLPGTDDQEAQDQLVKDYLLTSDLIIQVLDGRKLMTLQEREYLRDWLYERGIKTVIFVVNFLNLLEREDQKSVQLRLRTLAEEFRSQLPMNVNNLYRVDALPALRARLKQDEITAQTTGITTLETALQTLTTHLLSETAYQSDRCLPIIKKVIELGKLKQEKLLKAENERREKQIKRLNLQKKASQLLNQGFQQAFGNYQQWLYLPNLLNTYQTPLQTALQQNNFEQWKTQELIPKMTQFHENLDSWIQKSCQLMDKNCPSSLSVNLPDLSEETLPKNEPTSTVKRTLSPEMKRILLNPIGAVVVGGASYVFDKATGKLKSSSTAENSLSDYQQASHDYLNQLSQEMFLKLQEYEQQFQEIITICEETVPEQTPETHYQLQLLEEKIRNLQEI